MRALQWRSVAGGIEENLKVNNRTDLPKGAHSLPKGQTFVKVAYVSLNHLDYKVAEMPLGSMLFKKPATPGLDFSGTVIDTTLANLKPGQRVFGRTESPACGTLAEFVVVGMTGIAPVPAGVSLKDASCVGICGVTALQSLVPFLKQGSSILINGGSGGVGVFAIQIAKLLGCTKITAVCSGQNADLCRRLGADDTIDYRSEDPPTVLERNGHHYDHILDIVFADPSLYWCCHHYLKPGGTYVAVGLPLTIKTLRTLLAIHLLPRFLGGGQRAFRFHSVTANPEHFTEVARWIAEGSVKPVVEEELDFEDAGKAYGRLKSQRTVDGLTAY
ncbi:zinc-type alcohol dehydrogenase-like protein C16A3.02c [Colletotrichum liriopes]|uniref:Zinc-type alcohol dehydrogenase-like protein C16A3.02c n=1 Tax=Colletotrichum liriopes TaxID=708192 RepID=A0AA37LPJ1_9PEZI|nr:zinc-type alcohol dehydrogenase-like protein C16A3.02c [Colletotrichum liriopes]